MGEQSYNGIEVVGEALGAMLDAFRQYPSIVMKYLSKHGLTDKSGQIDRSAWYPMEGWIAAYHAIAKDVGLNSLYTIGKRIPENAPLPPHIKDIRTALTGIDIAYHASHRKNGEPMWNPATGEILEGIGHYKCELAPNEQKTLVICDSPFPCELDRGIVTGFATRFEPMAKVAHENNAPCRKKGAPSCTYVVSW
jgi:hypothetical protein